jgi:hypothetical protein
MLLQFLNFRNLFFMFKAWIPGHMWLEINHHSVIVKAAEVEVGVYPDITSGPYLPDMDME